jgi:hypothetical protein
MAECNYAHLLKVLTGTVNKITDFNKNGVFTFLSNYTYYDCHGPHFSNISSTYGVAVAGAVGVARWQQWQQWQQWQ